MKLLIFALLLSAPAAQAYEIDPEVRACIIRLVEADQAPIERIIDFCSALNSPGEQ